MNYSPKYFYQNMPLWKRKKDPILTRIFYRPISFVFASICAKLKISANTVSYFNILIAISSCVLFLFNNFICAIIGASLVNFWLLLDCTDGNLARGFKKQPYGDFADCLSSYIMMALLPLCVGFYTFNNGGVLIENGCIRIIFIGAIGSTSDTLMRLIYQKYKSSSTDLVNRGIIENFDDSRNDTSKSNSFKVRIESDFGLGGIIPLFILFAVIFHFTDIFLFYCLFYYGGACIISSINFIIKAIKCRNKLL